MSGWVAGAIAVGGVIGAGAQVYAAGESSKATSAASSETAATAQSNVELQEKMYDQTRMDNESWRLAGEDALKSIQDTPDFQFESEEFDFFADPSYQFRLDEGINALDRSAAARGRVLSGAQDKAISRYGQDLASQEYSNAFNRFRAEEGDRFSREKSIYDTNLNTQKSLANVGQQVSAQTQQAGDTMASNVANITSQSTASQNALAIENAQAQGDMATGVATSANQAMGNYLLYKSL